MAKKKKIKQNKRSAPHSYMSQQNPTVVIQNSTSPKRKMKLSEALQIANKHVEESREEQAQSIYAQLIDQCPTAREPAIRLLKSFRSRGRYNAAQVQAYGILNLFKTDPWALAEVANFFQVIDKPDKCIEVLNNGLEQCSDNLHVLWRTMGSVYAAQGKNSEAIDAFQKALQQEQGDILSLFGLTLIAKKTLREELLDKLLTVLHSDSFPIPETAHLHFALAYVYEGHDNEKYFYHLDIANAAAATSPKQYIEESKKAYHNTINNFSTQYEQLPIHRPTQKAPLFIIAPARSGTTLLEQILGSHPDTLGVGESSAMIGAVNRTAKDLHQLTPFYGWDIQALSKAPAKIENNFYIHERIPKDIGDRIIVDKSIDNYQLVGAIILTWPDARIIRLKRNPLDTILSCYHQFFSSGHNHLFNLSTLAFYYVQIQKFMDFWQDLFPENILTIEYESLIANQEQETKRLLEFCDLPWDDACMNFHINVGTVLTASNQQVRQPLYNKSVEKWKPFYKQLEPARIILERELNCTFEP